MNIINRDFFSIIMKLSKISFGYVFIILLNYLFEIYIYMDIFKKNNSNSILIFYFNIFIQNKMTIYS